jgi:pinin
MAAAEVPKTAEELRREIEELHRQQREITERLRDPRGLRKNGPQGGNVRNNDPNSQQLGRNNPLRGNIRRGEAFEVEDQPPRKRRLLSAVVKVSEEEKPSEPEKEKEGVEEVQPDKDDVDEETDVADRRPTLQRNYNADDSRPLTSGDSQRRGNNDQNARTANNGGPHTGGPGGLPKRFPRERGFLVRVSNPPGQQNQDAQPAEPLPRVLPKTSDPNVAKRNRRMFGALLGTLEKFRQEDKKLSGSEAFQRRSDQLKRAEQKAQEESERLRQQEREAMAEKRRVDLTLRAKLAAEADAKQLELLFLQWTEHHTRLCTFIQTKAGPAIYYCPAKPCEETDKLLQDAQQDLQEWTIRTREELTEYQKQISEVSTANLDAEIERWKNGPSGRSKNTSDTILVEADMESDVANDSKEQLVEGLESVEDEDDEAGPTLVEEEDRVTLSNVEVKKVMTTVQDVEQEGVLNGAEKTDGGLKQIQNYGRLEKIRDR